MLKRQRVSSPPPQVPPTPWHFSDPPLDEQLARTIKRRRIQPDPQDQGPISDESMLEGPIVIDTRQDFGENDSNNYSTHNTQYKATNEMLHELHILNQHRLSFSSPSSMKQHLPSFHSHSRRPTPLQANFDLAGARHYHEANRLLGSLFLSRRRATQSTDGKDDEHSNNDPHKSESIADNYFPM